VDKRHGSVETLHGLLVLGLAAALVTGGCDSDGSGPDREVYEVRVGGQETTQQQDGTVTVEYDLIVEDAGDQRVSGAFLKYEVSAGTITASSATSGSAGFAGVVWELTPEDAAGLEEATLAACAENSDPPICEPQVIATIHLVGE